MRRRLDTQTDFDRFRRALTTRDPGPGPFGEIFADFAMKNYLGQRVLNYPEIPESAFLEGCCVRPALH